MPRETPYGSNALPLSYIPTFGWDGEIRTHDPLVNDNPLASALSRFVSPLCLSVLLLPPLKQIYKK